MLSQWRTVITICVLSIVLLVALWMVRGMPPDFGGRALDTVAMALLGFALAQAGKSGVQHLAGGRGVKGALRALTTDDKPDPPEDPKP